MCNFLYSFQFTISPVRQPKPQKVEKKEEPEINILSLAPFTPNPKICFDDIKIGSVTTKQLLIRNPNKLDIEVNSCKFLLPNLQSDFYCSFY